jgi:drug/metabolite transporter (DMT)-like permease
VNRTTTAYVSLAFASFLFGATFVVVKEAIATLPPLGFVGWRFLIGAAVLLLLAPPRDRTLWRDGAVAGFFLFAGYSLQTLGLEVTSASNSALITGLYVVLTPLVAAAARRTPPAVITVVGTTTAFIGFTLLTWDGGFSLRRGDVLTLGCAIAFAVHIVILARLAPRHRVVPFTAVQLTVTAVLALAASAAAEGFPLPGADVAAALLLTGVVVSAGAFLLQVWSQTVVGPSRTAIVLSLEPAFAAGAAAVVLEERLDTVGWIGAATILVAIYLVLALTPEGEDDLPGAEAVSAAH